MCVAIIGCRPAGPTAAVFLRQLGHKVIVFERAPECRAVGAGFLLQPPGMDVLDRLGILDAGTEPLVSLFWSVKIADDAPWRRRPIDEWKAELRAHCLRAEGLLDQIEDWDQVLCARYGDVRMSRWHGDGLIVLGDVGHAMSPQLGQGVNLASADGGG